MSLIRFHGNFAKVAWERIEQERELLGNDALELDTFNSKKRREVELLIITLLANLQFGDADIKRHRGSTRFEYFKSLNKINSKILRLIKDKEQLRLEFNIDGNIEYFDLGTAVGYSAIIPLTTRGYTDYLENKVTAFQFKRAHILNEEVLTTCCRHVFFEGMFYIGYFTDSYYDSPIERIGVEQSNVFFRKIFRHLAQFVANPILLNEDRVLQSNPSNCLPTLLFSDNGLIAASLCKRGFASPAGYAAKGLAYYPRYVLDLQSYNDARIAPERKSSIKRLIKLFLKANTKQVLSSSDLTETFNLPKHNMKNVSPDNSERSALRYLSPESLIYAAKEAHPAFKYAIVIGGLFGIIAVVNHYGVSPATLVFGSIILVVLMVLFLVFSQAAVVAKAHLSLPAMFLVWSFLILSVLTAIALFTSTFYDNPLPFKDYIIKQLNTAKSIDNSFRIQPDKNGKIGEYNVTISFVKIVKKTADRSFEQNFSATNNTVTYTQPPTGGAGWLIDTNSIHLNKTQGAASDPVVLEGVPTPTGFVYSMHCNEINQSFHRGDGWGKAIIAWTEYFNSEERGSQRLSGILYSNKEISIDVPASEATEVTGTITLNNHEAFAFSNSSKAGPFIIILNKQNGKLLIKTSSDI